MTSPIQMVAAQPGRRILYTLLDVRGRLVDRPGWIVEVCPKGCAIAVLALPGDHLKIGDSPMLFFDQPVCTRYDDLGVGGIQYFSGSEAEPRRQDTWRWPNI